MKKKFALIFTLVFGVLLFSGAKGYAEEDATTQRLSFQPYFSSITMSKNIKPFETVDYLIPRLPVISGYNVNYTFYVRTYRSLSENFLVHNVSQNGQCVKSEELVAGKSSSSFFGSTVGDFDFGNDYLVAKVTNLSPVSLIYEFTYSYKLSKDPTDFAGL